MNHTTTKELREIWKMTYSDEVRAEVLFINRKFSHATLDGLGSNTPGSRFLNEEDLKIMTQFVDDVATIRRDYER